MFSWNAGYAMVPDPPTHRSPALPDGGGEKGQAVPVSVVMVPAALVFS